MVIYLRRPRRVVTIDGFETAPEALRQDSFVDEATGRVIPSLQRETGGLAVGVPGTLALWQLALRKYGTMSLAPALGNGGRARAPRIRRRRAVCRDGRSGCAVARVQLEPGAVPDPSGEIPATETTRRNPELATTYTLIGRLGADVFYCGRIGQAVVDAVAHPPLAGGSPFPFTVRPGTMTSGDFAHYHAVERAPTHVTYRGYDIYGMAPRRVAVRRSPRRSTFWADSTSRVIASWRCTATSRPPG